MPNITLPDGKKLAFKEKVSGLKVAEKISKSLAKEALVISVDGKLKDLSYEIEKDASGTDSIKVALKYFDGEPVIKELKRVSTPGRRVYLGVDNLPKVRQGLGVAIVSTSKGIMSDAKARQSRVGGEVLCTVF